MNTEVGRMLGIDFALLAFSHPCDVVAAVTEDRGGARWPSGGAPAYARLGPLVPDAGAVAGER